MFNNTYDTLEYFALLLGEVCDTANSTLNDREIKLSKNVRYLIEGLGTNAENIKNVLDSKVNALSEKMYK